MLTLTSEKMTIYAKQRESHSGNTWYTYTTKISSKDKDGNWKTAFLDVGFKKGVTIANKSEIKVKNAFFVVDEYKEQTKLKLMVLDYEVISGGEGNGGIDSINIPVEEESPFMSVPDDIDLEVPFGL